jgi:hypothetical protein
MRIADGCGLAFFYKAALEAGDVVINEDEGVRASPRIVAVALTGPEIENPIQLRREAFDGIRMR